MDKNIYKQKFKDLRCCVLIPTYNNSGTIEKVLHDVLEYSDDVCVVNENVIYLQPTASYRFISL